MPTIFDAARYILNKQGGMTTMKLQKLCYYAQAWSLAWDDLPLFEEDFQAWASGPVNPELFQRHKGQYMLHPNFLGACAPGVFNDAQGETLDVVLQGYGEMKPYELSDLTHRERPWIEARGNTPLGLPCENVIDKEVMRDYYSGLISA